MTTSTVNDPEILPPSPWVTTHAGQIAAGGAVLDLACGSGRHARWLAAQGFAVSAVDRSFAAISALQTVPGVCAEVMELEGDTWPLAGRCFAGVVVTNYLWRPRFPELLALLAPGGVLIYETFMLGNAAFGKPANPDFLLAPGELRERAEAAGLRVIDFVEGKFETPKPAMRQAICAVRD